jgi:ribosomal protein L37AE/L43A
MPKVKTVVCPTCKGSMVRDRCFWDCLECGATLHESEVK